MRSARGGWSLAVIDTAGSEVNSKGTGQLRRLALWSALLLAGLVAIVLLSSLIGQADLSWTVWQIRMPRILAAAVVGAALAVAGVALQSLLRNPLASPFVLGISSGSGLGVLVGMIMHARGVGFVWLNGPVMAIIGALGTMGVVYIVAQRRGRVDPYSLLLAGVIVNAFNGAVTLFVYLYASQYVIADYISWSMGSIPDVPNVQLLLSAGTLTLGGWVFMLMKSQAFNVQSLGDDVAVSSGINVHVLRLGTFVASSVMTAAAVALAGPVGFVGLIIPHICRMMVGADHRRLTIAAGFVGAAFLVLADTFCRSTVLAFRRELPVGVITAFCGGPFFIYLLRRQFGGEGR